MVFRKDKVDFWSVYVANFDVHLGEEDKSWALHFVTKSGIEHLRH